MHKLFIDGDGPYEYTYSVNTETVDVSTLSSYTPDPHWFTVDINGHFHAFDKDGKTPTLEAHCCILCGDQIDPSYRVGGPKYESVTTPPVVTIVVKKYPTYSTIGTRVTFHTSNHFGIARISHIDCNVGVHCEECTCPIAFNVTLVTELIAARNSSADLFSL